MKKLLAGLMPLGLLAAVAMGVPATASAHLGHTCSSNAPSDAGFFECKTGYSSPPSRYISSYYTGSERGFVAVWRRSDDKLGFQVCDMYTDNFRPTLEVKLSSGTVLRYSDWNRAGCSTYERDYSVRSIRVVHYKLSGGISHGSGWYDFPF